MSISHPSQVTSIPAARINLPEALIVFDGVCNFCSGYVRLISRLDTQGVIYFTPIQSNYGRLLCERNGVDPTDPSTFLFVHNGNVKEATDALAAMFALLPQPWRSLRFLVLLPRPWRNGIYRWVARNRYSLLGKRRECMIPPARVRERFIFDPPADI